MAISQKYSDTNWSFFQSDLTIDLSGVTPAPVAGDRFYVWVGWKPYTVTATMTGNWTEVTEFADGTVAQGDGVGSMKIACWYSTYRTGDGNPDLLFSVAPNIAGGFIQLWQKGSTESWGTPSFVTAAWPSQTSGTVSASNTVDVPNGSVVMCGVTLRDDTATFTRPTTAIDVASGITWNGNYVESPATHGSSAVGNDMAGDLGYRLVTTGAAGATLRTTISALTAAETGSILWVVQGFGPARCARKSQAVMRANLY